MKIHRLIPVLALLTTFLSNPALADTPVKHRPIVFLHGSAGSGLQYETQAKRFAGNGYPAEYIEAHEYDSPNIAAVLPDVYAGLDARIGRLLSATGADRVDLAAHSLGTFVMQGYLNSSPARAARVAHYVNLDGRTAAAPPGGVPTLAIWGEGDQTRAIAGATNTYLPDQSHTQTVTSQESFVAQYTFFNGSAPRTSQVKRGPTTLAGRAVLFPSNAGVTGARLEIYRVGALTGHRLSHRPLHTYELSGDGAFGPFRADPDARYEFAIVYAGGQTHHLYFQPFRRTDRLIRLLTSRPGEGIGALTETGPHHSNLTISRNKEWWGDQGEAGDAVFVNGTNVLNAANSPRVKRVIGMFAYDANVDRVTDLSAPIPAFYSQTFITGMDVYVPARGIVALAVRPRGGGLDVVNVPAWPSDRHRIGVQVNDYR
ncbi:lipase [Virgisporangium aliadipatigenens]|uniref:Lipase n=1 Tax=Virgisporangium aliadipatigenens TaxID=741659 RepID=A0A8J3YT60_9ACTN|nr:alpha/beta hydrolase [Virgisporangium aliadipatigenens]GIJ49430.1 lipase [Virgisporangium aliadipatigenens]